MARFFLSAVALSALAAFAQDAPKTYRDIALREDSGTISFANSRLSLTFSRDRGDWLSFRSQTLGELIQARQPSPAVDARVDDVWLIETHGAKLGRTAMRIDEQRQAATLCLSLRTAPSTTPPLLPARWNKPGQPPLEFEIESCYTLFPESQRLERRAKLHRIGGADLLRSDFKRAQGFLFVLPGAAPGNPQDCTVEAPGPMFPDNVVLPGTPYGKLLERRIALNSAPDLTFGFIGLRNHARDTTLASWMDTGGEVAYLSWLHGDGERLSILQFDQRIDRVGRDGSLASDTQHIELVPGPLEAAFSRYRENLTATLPLHTATPEWVRDMVVLEVLPAYFKDGFKGITASLPRYKEIGFNTVYLMPHWEGPYSGYSPVDLYKVRPELGTPQDLAELVRTAHKLGMRVLFDMVIHGFNPQSPVIREHPEFFQRNEAGVPVPHQTWASITTDPANPGYQKYMSDLVLHDINRYGIDGYRVDANAYRMPNWDPSIAYEPWRSASGTRPLMERMLRAMRSAKPDAILLSEIFGPVWHSVSNVVHDNMTMAPILVLEAMDRGEMTAAQYKRSLADVMSLLPPGALRVRFARNHDTSWFYHFKGYTPRFFALDAVHAFFGIPEVFAGDPNHGPNPDDDPAVWDFYRKLFKVRRDIPALTRGEVAFAAAESSNPMLITGMRGGALVVVSFSGAEEDTTITLAKPGPKELLDIRTGARIPARIENGKLRLTAQPYQILVGAP